MKEHYTDALESFVQEMDDRLFENKHKSGWENTSVHQLFSLCQVNMQVVESVGMDIFDIEQIKESCVDAANYLMMIYNKIVKESKCQTE